MFKSSEITASKQDAKNKLDPIFCDALALPTFLSYHISFSSGKKLKVQTHTPTLIEPTHYFSK